MAMVTALNQVYSERTPKAGQYKKMQLGEGKERERA